MLRTMENMTEAKKLGVSVTVIKRAKQQATKDATRRSNLKDGLTDLLKEYNPDEIFMQMVSIVEKYPNPDYLKYLTDEVILYLQIYQNMNMVKIDSLNQQFEFEAAIEKIIPYANDQHSNLFLKL